jgi:hypothetical protein
VSLIKSFQNCPALCASAFSGGADKSTNSSLNPSGDNLPPHDDSAAKTTLWPRFFKTFPIPMQF